MHWFIRKILRREADINPQEDTGRSMDENNNVGRQATEIAQKEPAETFGSLHQETDECVAKREGEDRRQLKQEILALILRYNADNPENPISEVDKPFILGCFEADGASVDSMEEREAAIENFQQCLNDDSARIHEACFYRKIVELEKRFASNFLAKAVGVWFCSPGSSGTSRYQMVQVLALHLQKNLGFGCGEDQQVSLKEFYAAVNGYFAEALCRREAEIRQTDGARVAARVGRVKPLENFYPDEEFKVEHSRRRLHRETTESVVERERYRRLSFEVDKSPQDKIEQQEECLKALEKAQRENCEEPLDAWKEKLDVQFCQVDSADLSRHLRIEIEGQLAIQRQEKQAAEQAKIEDLKNRTKQQGECLKKIERALEKYFKELLNWKTDMLFRQLDADNLYGLISSDEVHLTYVNSKISKRDLRCKSLEDLERIIEHGYPISSGEKVTHYVKVLFRGLCRKLGLKGGNARTRTSVEEKAECQDFLRKSRSEFAQYKNEMVVCVSRINIDAQACVKAREKYFSLASAVVSNESDRSKHHESLLKARNDLKVAVREREETLRQAEARFSGLVDVRVSLSSARAEVKRALALLERLETESEKMQSEHDRFSEQISDSNALLTSLKAELAAITGTSSDHTVETHSDDEVSIYDRSLSQESSEEDSDLEDGVVNASCGSLLRKEGSMVEVSIFNKLVRGEHLSDSAEFQARASMPRCT